MQLGIRCTPVCLTNRCRQNCLAMIENRLAVEKSDFPIPMKFDDVITQNVYLQFCSFTSVMTGKFFIDYSFLSDHSISTITLASVYSEIVS